MYGLGIAPDGRNVYVADDCLYMVTNFKRDPDTGSLVFKDQLEGSATNGDGLGCIKSLSFASSGVSFSGNGGGGSGGGGGGCTLLLRKSVRGVLYCTKRGRLGGGGWGGAGGYVFLEC